MLSQVALFWFFAVTLTFFGLVSSLGTALESVIDCECQVALFVLFGLLTRVFLSNKTAVVCKCYL